MRSPLIGVEELAGLLGVVTVLDVRWRLGGPDGAEQFRRGHVPGARFVDLETVLADPPGPRGRHPLPSPERFGAGMRAAGVSSRQQVVVLDDWQGRAAARAWWLLRHHGHPSVRVLDGGWSAWQEAGGPVETGESPPGHGDFEASRDPQGMRVVGVEEVLDVEVVVDARAPERHRGELEPVDPVAGHVPGAVNVPTETNLDVRGRFRTAPVLQALYAASGVVPGSDVVAHCGSGITACHDVLAMEVAGIRAGLHPGGWSEWVSDPRRPVARPGQDD